MSATTKHAKANPDGRGANGRFAKGNKGGPGNPYARQVADLRSVLVETLTRDDLREIAEAMILRAKGGNVSAAKLLLQYTLGKPVEQPHPDRIDADEMEAFQANSMKRDAIAALDATPVQPALVALRELRTACGDQFLSDLKADIQAVRNPEDQAQPAVNKREKPAQPMPVSVPRGLALADTETIRLVNLPERCAANDVRS